MSLWIITIDIRFSTINFFFFFLFFSLCFPYFFSNFQEDIELIEALGFSAYRFSISWSRIFPGMLFISFPTLSLTYIHFKLEYRYSIQLSGSSSVFCYDSVYCLLFYLLFLRFFSSLFLNLSLHICGVVTSFICEKYNH